MPICLHHAFKAIGQKRFAIYGRKRILALSSKHKGGFMKMNRIAIGLTVINLVLVTILLAQFRPAQAKEYKQPINSVLRGSALEIVDSLGKTRATISILPPSVVDGKKYPQTVLLRLIDSKGKPIVKLSAAEDGSGLMLIDESDDGVILRARDAEGSIKFTSKGKEKILKL